MVVILAAEDIDELRLGDDAGELPVDLDQMRLERGVHLLRAHPGEIAVAAFLRDLCRFLDARGGEHALHAVFVEHGRLPRRQHRGQGKIIGFFNRQCSFLLKRHGRAAPKDH